jgi:cytochrome c biogenesis protein
LVIDGHRIYTSPNKGFAPLLRWLPTLGEPVLGAVHLPSFPVHELRQSREWPLPDGREAWVMLQFDQTLIDPAKTSSFRLPDEHRLIVRIGSQRASLAPGERLTLDGGTLVYEGLHTWMGYRVTYDPTLPWLLAASLLASLALAAHYVRKFWFASRVAAPLPRVMASAADG